MGDERQRALALLRETAEACAERLERFDGGALAAHRRFPLLWDANHIRLSGPWPGDAGAVDARLGRAEEAAGLHHRVVVVDEDGDAQRLAAGFSALGYRRDEQVLMALRRPPDRDAPVAVEDVPLALCRGIREATVRDHPELGDDVVAQVLDHDAHLHETLFDRWMAAFRDGRPAACARVLSRGGVGQVEDVATLSEARGHGLARSLVLGGVARLRAEGCDLIVIVCDAQGFPRDLYGRLGFDVIGAIRRFRRAT